MKKTKYINKFKNMKLVYKREINKLQYDTIQTQEWNRRMSLREASNELRDVF